MKSLRVITTMSAFSLSLIGATLRADDAALTSNTDASLKAQTDAKATLDANAAAAVQAQTQTAVNSTVEAAAAAAGSATATATTSADVKADAQASSSTQTQAQAETKSETTVNSSVEGTLTSTANGVVTIGNDTTAKGETSGDAKVTLGGNLANAADLKGAADLAAGLKIGLIAEKPERPERPSLGSEISAEVRAMIDKVSAQKEALLAAQAQLLLQMRTAAAAQRDQLRDTLKTEREAWIDTRHTLVLDTKARLDEIRAEFKNSTDIAAVISAAKEDARNRRN